MWSVHLQPWVLDRTLAEAHKHRRTMWIEETAPWAHIWAAQRPGLPTDLKPAHAVFLCAGGAQLKGVKWGLARGGSATAPLHYQWLGVSRGGRLSRTPEDGAAFIWLARPDDRSNSVAVYTPMEAAIAGASADCIRFLCSRGGNLEAAMKWLLGLPLAVPRVEAGFVLCRLVDSLDPLYRLPLQEWIRRVQKWTRRQRPRGERVLNIHRDLSRICPHYGLSHQTEPVETAEML
jgi:hypothetical protein